MSQPLDISEKASARVSPASRPPNFPLQSPTSVPLSLIDSTVVNFTKTGALWFLSPSKLTAEHLKRALITTLNAYPQWCGRIQQIPLAAESGNFNHRQHGRIKVVHNRRDDPGVDLSIAESSSTLADLTVSAIPATGLFKREPGLFDPLYPHTTFQDPLSNSEDTHSPAVAIKVTTLSDSAIVIGVKIHHSLADAHGLVHFIKDWAHTSRALLAGEQPPLLAPIFSPDLLTSQASIPGPTTSTPDPALLRAAHTLPFERNDWWAGPSARALPKELKLDTTTLEPAGNPMPWQHWDVNAPVSRYTIHISKAQTDKIAMLAGQGVSRHDALVAHIWTAINRARGLADEDGDVHLDYSIGLRVRLGLGEAFQGSPIVMADVRLPGRVACAAPSSSESGEYLAPVAGAVRKVVAQLDEKALQLYLYGLAYEKSLQRIWQGFLGKRNVICTSWCRTGVYGLDFGGGSRVEAVDALMPVLDGIMQIMEGRPGGEHFSGGKASWYEHGVDVVVNLDSGAMERLIKDPLLFP